MEVPQIVTNLSTFVLNPIIALLFGIALVVFLWGVAEYFWQQDSDAARTQASRHMIWGILGMFIMFAAFAIVRILAGTIGVDVPASI
jgi:Na+-driven multidrug efflux pump